MPTFVPKQDLAFGACLLSLGLVLAPQAHAQTAPQIFAPGVVSGPSNDADAAFTPDGRTVVFSRDGALMISDKTGTAWSPPRIAPFSGEWMDLQPTMSPDGRFLIFVSNRPVAPTDTGHPHGNLWRVARNGASWGASWGAPEHLPATINADQSIWGPSVAADGTLYFMRRADPKAPWHLWMSRLADGQYQVATELTFGDPTAQNVDPTVAPDQSFIVFSSKHPATDAHEHLYISFRDGDRWRTPVDLGEGINGDGSHDVNESRLGPDGETLYFTTDRTLPVTYPRTPAQADMDRARIESWDNGDTNIWSVSLKPWLNRQGKP